MRRRFAAIVVPALVVVTLFAVACGGKSAPPPSTGLQPGSIAPEFSLPSAQGATVSLAEFRGRKPVLLYFSMGPG